MTTITTPPGSIEGNKIYVTGQDIKPSSIPQRINEHTIVYPIDIKKRGEGEIIEEFNNKKSRVRPYSLLEEGSKIQGKILYGHSATPVKSVSKGGGGRTSGHTGQEVTISNCCYLELISGFYGYPLAIHPKSDIYIT